MEPLKIKQNLQIQFHENAIYKQEHLMLKYVFKGSLVLANLLIIGIKV